MMMTEGFKDNVTKFVKDAQGVINEHMKQFPSLGVPKLTLDVGNRYIKVVREETHGKSVYCFIDMKNGDVLRAATWKAPAKHARGNISTYTDINQVVSPYGAHYLK